MDCGDPVCAFPVRGWTLREQTGVQPRKPLPKLSTQLRLVAQI
jgi:hypothetical protein